jgi:hypothetical protein
MRASFQNPAITTAPLTFPGGFTGPGVKTIAHSGLRTSFDPDLTAAMCTAYRAVIMELRLSEREDAGTLMVAKRVVEIAGRGERDPHRLARATLELLLR